MPDVMNVMFLPLWVPTSLLKFVGSAPALLDADIEAVKTQVSVLLIYVCLKGWANHRWFESSNVRVLRPGRSKERERGKKS